MRHSTLQSVLVVLVLVLFAATADAQLGSEYAEWADGPAGLLFTKMDKKAWTKIAHDAQAEEFIELFWARRSPDGNTAFNAFQANFEARVAYADEFFGFGNVRGAMSDRGKVLILLGGPRQRQIHDPNVVDLHAGVAVSEEQPAAEREDPGEPTSDVRTFRPAPR